MKLIMMGVIKTACPIETPKGFRNRFKEPKGPVLENMRYRIRPRATVGIPKRALNRPFMNLFPAKLLRPNATPIGIHHKIDRVVAVPEI
jgi:hypothetical protein